MLSDERKVLVRIPAPVDAGDLVSILDMIVVASGRVPMATLNLGNIEVEISVSELADYARRVYTEEADVTS